MVVCRAAPPMLEALRASGVACPERLDGRGAPDAPERVYGQRLGTGC
jgi:hypothetical protein